MTILKNVPGVEFRWYFSNLVTRVDSLIRDPTSHFKQIETTTHIFFLTFGHRDNLALLNY
jgi:hypothetical protein